MSANLQLHEVEKLVAAVNCKDRARQLEATTQFRKLLSIGTGNDVALLL
jgi:hypothetical protein